MPEFTDRFADGSKAGHAAKPTGNHPFDRACAEAGIRQRTTRRCTPRTNGIPLGDCRQSPVGQRGIARRALRLSPGKKGVRLLRLRLILSRAGFQAGCDLAELGDVASLNVGVLEAGVGGIEGDHHAGTRVDVDVLAVDAVGLNHAGGVGHAMACGFTAEWRDNLLPHQDCDGLTGAVADHPVEHLDVDRDMVSGSARRSIAIFQPPGKAVHQTAVSQNPAHLVDVTSEIQVTLVEFDASGHVRDAAQSGCVIGGPFEAGRVFRHRIVERGDLASARTMPNCETGTDLAIFRDHQRGP